MHTRRALLRAATLAAGSAIVTPALVRAAVAKTAPDASRQLAFDNLHTGETLRVEYWAEGDYVPQALTDVNHILRDWRTDTVHTIDPKLLDLLHHLHGRLESSSPFEVICGYRSPATNEMLHEHSSGVAAHSLHMQGMAIDIRLTDRRLTELHQAALDLRAGGVGYYPSSNFVHVDIGRVRRWGG